MRADTREELVGLIHSNPTAEVVLPDEFYIPGRNEIRTQIDGVKVQLHRWLYVQLTGIELGRDSLRRDPAHDPRNVNPLLMERVTRRERTSSTQCPKGHIYSETGELPAGRPDRRRCLQCWREARDRINAAERVGGVDQASANRNKTHCPMGHEYTPENTLRWKGDAGRRRCLTCQTNRSKQRWQERKNRDRTQEA